MVWNLDEMALFEGKGWRVLKYFKIKKVELNPPFLPQILP